MIVRRKAYNPPNQKDVKFSFNDYNELTQDYVEGAITNDALISTYTPKELKDMISKPEDMDNIEKIRSLMLFHYLTNGQVQQTFLMYQCLSDLNFKIRVFDNKAKKFEDYMSIVNKSLYKVKYKEITRDIISQVMFDGECVTLWCGNAKNLYLYIFSDTRYVFPKYRTNGDWQCVIDLSMFDDYEEDELLNMMNHLNGIVSEKDIAAYQNNTQDKELRYKLLPMDRCTYIKWDRYKRNTRLSLPAFTQSLLDLAHKEQLKNVEKAISQRIIKNVATLTLGSKDDENKSYDKIPPNIRKKVITNCMKAISTSADVDTGKLPLATLPEYATLSFNKVDGVDAFDKSKFENVDNALNNDFGMSPAISSGTGNGNYSSSSLNYEFNVKKINLLLEQIQDVFNKMIAIVLPKNQADNFYFEFMTSNMTSEEKLTQLNKLLDKGGSMKCVVDQIPDLSWDDYLEMVRYETEDLKLQELFQPYRTSNTMSSEDSTSKEEVSNPTNDNTIKSKTSDGNNTPKAE